MMWRPHTDRLRAAYYVYANPLWTCDVWEGSSGWTWTVNRGDHEVTRGESPDEKTAKRAATTALNQALIRARKEKAHGG